MPSTITEQNDLPLYWSNRVEKGSGYTSGGYPPVHLGDTYAHRYVVIHKLGHGGFATVWLARDQSANRYVAIKMAKASGSNDRSPESETLRLLRERDTTHAGHDHISHLLERFEIRSPNGTHECLVFTLNGPPIRCPASKAHQQIGAKYARVLCKQLLMAVDYIHSRHIVHADITPGNLLLGLKDEIHHLSTRRLLDMIGHPKLIPVERSHGGEVPPSYPRYVVEPANLWGLSTLITPNLYLTDFGEAFDTRNTPIRHGLGGIPAAYKAPEVWFERAQSKAADLWSVACCFNYIRFGYDLIDVMGGASIAVFDMIDLLGGIPSQWENLYFDNLTNAKPRSDYEKNKARNQVVGVGFRPNLPLEPESVEPWPKCLEGSCLSARMKARWDDVQSADQIPKTRQGKKDNLPGGWRIQITPDEASLLSDLLSRLLRWQPSQRRRAAELLQHEWFDVSRYRASDVAAIDPKSLLQFSKA